MTNADTGDDDEVFHSLTAEGTEGTDGPPASVGNVTATALPSNLQMLGRRAEELHTHDHMKESELTAKAVKKRETFPTGDPLLTRKPLWYEETPTSNERESEKLQEAEGRVRQLEAELDVAKKEKNDLEHQVAEVRAKCEKAKQKVVASAEADKNHLIETSEHLHRTNDSLNALLCERDDAIKQLKEELRRTKGLFEAMSDVSVVKRDSTISDERRSSFPLRAGEARGKVESPNSNTCTVEEKQSDELKTMRKALEQSRELAQKAKQELPESAQLQKEQESQEERVRRLKQQHQDEAAELKTKVKHAEDSEKLGKDNSQAVLLAKEEELKQVNEKLHDSSQEIGNLQVCVHMYYLCPTIAISYGIRLYSL